MQNFAQMSTASNPGRGRTLGEGGYWSLVYRNRFHTKKNCTNSKTIFESITNNMVFDSFLPAAGTFDQDYRGDTLLVWEGHRHPPPPGLDTLHISRREGERELK